MELQPFITGVPEKTISKKAISDLPTREFIVINNYYASAFGAIDFYTVPEGSVLEISSIHWSIINASLPASDSLFRLETIKPSPVSNEHTIFDIYIGSVCCKEGYENYTPLTQFVRGGDSLRQLINANAGKVSKFSVTITGFLINKTEFQTKTNIIL